MAISTVGAPRGHVAEWLRNGLQNRVPRFNSGRGLHLKFQELRLDFRRTLGPRFLVVGTLWEPIRRFCRLIYFIICKPGCGLSAPAPSPMAARAYSRRQLLANAAIAASRVAA